MRSVTSLALAVLALGALAAPSSAVHPPSIPNATLSGQHATLQFTGDMITHWTLGPTESDDSCQLDTRHGQGSQTLQYSTVHGGHANRAEMTILDAGNSVTFRPTTRPDAHHDAPGFRFGQMHQLGTIEDDFTNSPHRDPFGCPPLPDPPEQTQDDSGCGGEEVPWDVQITVTGSRLQVFVYGIAGDDLVAHCPFFAPPDAQPAGSVGSFPEKMVDDLSLSHVRSVMEKRNGKLIVHYKHRWHSEAPVDGVPMTETTTVTWKITLIHAR